MAQRLISVVSRNRWRRINIVRGYIKHRDTLSNMNAFCKVYVLRIVVLINTAQSIYVDLG